MDKEHIVKLSVNLSSEVVDTIRSLAERRGITMTEVIRDAIGSEKFVVENQEHSKFLLEDHDGTLRRVVFR